MGVGRTPRVPRRVPASGPSPGLSLSVAVVALERRRHERTVSERPHPRGRPKRADALSAGARVTDVHADEPDRLSTTPGHAGRRKNRRSAV
jgi:hypothetical protein